MGDIHNNVTGVLRAGLRAAEMRQAAIANNIANANTAGYARRSVAFEQRLAEAVAGGDAAEVARLQPEIVAEGGPLNEYGNDVDVDQELADLIKNSGAYKTYLRLLARSYQQMELAMRTE